MSRPCREVSLVLLVASVGTATLAAERLPTGYGEGIDLVGAVALSPESQSSACLDLAHGGGNLATLLQAGGLQSIRLLEPEATAPSGWTVGPTIELPTFPTTGGRRAIAAAPDLVVVVASAKTTFPGRLHFIERVASGWSLTQSFDPAADSGLLLGEHLAIGTEGIAVAATLAGAGGLVLYRRSTTGWELQGFVPGPPGTRVAGLVSSDDLFYAAFSGGGQQSRVAILQAGLSPGMIDQFDIAMASEPGMGPTPGVFDNFVSVGYPFYTSPAVVEVYDRSGAGGWSVVAELSGTPAQNSTFGSHTAFTSGGDLVVASDYTLWGPSDDPTAALGGGGFAVFRESSAGDWRLLAAWHGHDGLPWEVTTWAPGIAIDGADRLLACAWGVPAELFVWQVQGAAPTIPTLDRATAGVLALLLALAGLSLLARSGPPPRPRPSADRPGRDRSL